MKKDFFCLREWSGSIGNSCKHRGQKQQKPFIEMREKDSFEFERSGRLNLEVQNQIHCFHIKASLSEKLNATQQSSLTIPPSLKFKPHCPFFLFLERETF